jgi:hypothetical protein
VEFSEEGPSLRIGDGLGSSITFRAGSEPFHDGYDFVDFPVSVSADGLAASTVVRSVEGPSPLALRLFMADIASEWKGLPEQRTWESIEHDLSIRARSDVAGHLVFTFILHENYQVSAWSASVTVNVEPGEEMSQVAAAIAHLLGGSSG